MTKKLIILSLVVTLLHMTLYTAEQNPCIPKESSAQGSQAEQKQEAAKQEKSFSIDNFYTDYFLDLVLHYKNNGTIKERSYPNAKRAFPIFQNGSPIQSIEIVSAEDPFTRSDFKNIHVKYELGEKVVSELIEGKPITFTILTIDDLTKGPRLIITPSFISQEELIKEGLTLNDLEFAKHDIEFTRTARKKINTEEELNRLKAALEETRCKSDTLSRELDAIRRQIEKVGRLPISFRRLPASAKPHAPPQKEIPECEDEYQRYMNELRREREMKERKQQGLPRYVKSSLGSASRKYEQNKGKE